LTGPCGRLGFRISNLIVSGGAGSGKTTLLGILSAFIPDDERLITIEDAAELRLAKPHVVSLEARPANVEGRGEVTVRDLVRNALRMRPDRIIVGEVRGGEALDMLQAMNTGHDGSLSTAHAKLPYGTPQHKPESTRIGGRDPVAAWNHQTEDVPVEIPDTRYARTADGLHIAYQTLGESPLDLVYVPGLGSHLGHAWGHPLVAKFQRTLASFSRLVVFDRRGFGLSDRITDEAMPTLEVRMDDIRAVMDEAGVERAALFGVFEGGPLCALFAATYPERTNALILYGAFAKGSRSRDYPWGQTEEEWRTSEQDIDRDWGTQAFANDLVEWAAPSLVNDENSRRWFGELLRLAASPGVARATIRMVHEIDVRAVLGAVRVPTLVLHREGDGVVDVEEARYVAGRIQGARLVVLTGADHIPWAGDQESVIRAIEQFLDVERPPVELDRVLATVMFTDIVGSTQKAVGLGDRAWRELVEDHHAMVRALLERFRGQEVDTAGDGFFATFDGPARGVRCAQVISTAVEPLGIQVRAGVHTGECEMIDGKVGGLGVVIGARVGALAGPSEVLVSQTVKDLTAGSGLTFEDRGEHELKGVPDRWHLYRVVSETA
jgi:pimeloyl-ACP methyl ester carboxylesterase